MENVEAVKRDDTRRELKTNWNSEENFPKSFVTPMGELTAF